MSAPDAYMTWEVREGSPRLAIKKYISSRDALSIINKKNIGYDPKENPPYVNNVTVIFSINYKKGSIILQNFLTAFPCGDNCIPNQGFSIKKWQTD